MSREQKAVNSKDVANRIERQQRDLTALIDRIIRLRRTKFTGLMVVVFEQGIAKKVGVKEEDTNGE